MPGSGRGSGLKAHLDGLRRWDLAKRQNVLSVAFWMARLIARLSSVYSE